MMLLIMAVPLLIAIYTVNYARWAWRQHYRLGALGLVVLALLTVGIPGYVLWQGG